MEQEGGLSMCKHDLPALRCRICLARVSKELIASGLIPAPKDQYERRIAAAEWTMIEMQGVYQ